MTLFLASLTAKLEEKEYRPIAYRLTADADKLNSVSDIESVTASHTQTMLCKSVR
jgi:hypothetical protein